ncbi:AraC family transcriptional regulator [Cohnella hashimotonis]|uniref:AraC family transcriptional regulator n=1 Tax=Cohnella hashimotonis TaxID=2826895 RepID=A0ABT6TMQ0_9BACL|nr:AraC family transcriptional regulator [Cohnella hashimotonis]MDI4648127.1 AraC family transcriptional regulator [Cohnella hashimotonis]
MKSKMLFCRTDRTSLLPVYVTSIGYWEHQPETEREEGFPDYQLHQTIRGGGEYTVEGRSVRVGPGEAFVLYPGVAHAYRPVSKPWEMAWVAFNGREAGALLRYAGWRASGGGRLAEAGLLEPFAAMLEGDSLSYEANLERSHGIYALLLELGRMQSVGNREQDINRMKPIVAYIEDNLHRALSLGELAEAAGVSPQYLCRLFQKTVQMRPLQYVNLQRVGRAKQLMFGAPGRRMHEVARDVGFDNASYFGAVFKKATGFSPEQFRRLYGLPGND